MTANGKTLTWRAWPVASTVSLLIGAISLFNTGDQSPWGIEWIILPFALLILVFIDLIPRFVLKRAVVTDHLVLPSWFVTLLGVHWVVLIMMVIPAALRLSGAESMVSSFVAVILVTFVATGVALVIASFVIRSRRGRA